MSFVAILYERPQCGVVSTGRRNTSIFLKRLSVSHEVLATYLLHRCAVPLELDWARVQLCIVFDLSTVRRRAWHKRPPNGLQPRPSLKPQTGHFRKSILASFSSWRVFPRAFFYCCSHSIETSERPLKAFVVVQIFFLFVAVTDLVYGIAFSRFPNGDRF